MNLNNFKPLVLSTHYFLFVLMIKTVHKVPWRRGLVVSYPPATEETGAVGPGIKSRLGSYEKNMHVGN
jgi:hypothetical protein